MLSDTLDVVGKVIRAEYVRPTSEHGGEVQSNGECCTWALTVNLWEARFCVNGSRGMILYCGVAICNRLEISSGIFKVSTILRALSYSYAIMSCKGGSVSSVEVPV